jgi:tetratricopeptide (TPR) repeat protein
MSLNVYSGTVELGPVPAWEAQPHECTIGPACLGGRRAPRPGRPPSTIVRTMLSKPYAALRRAMATALKSPQEALRILDAGLQEAAENGDHETVCSLARHAGVVSMALGDLHMTLRYYLAALGAAPDDASLHLAIGDVYGRQGRDDDARAAFTRGAELGKQQGDQDMGTMASKNLGALDRKAP